MSKETNRRAWIKNIAIIFLSVLLILTLFSNTILNRSLPEVSAQYVRYDTISGAVKLTGSVKANESYSVIFEEEAAEEGMSQTRKVVSVYVKPGQLVNMGDPILALKGGASAELEQTEKTLKEKQDAYDLDILGDKHSVLQETNEITNAENTLANSQAELAEKRKQYQTLLAGGDVSADIDAEIKALEKERESLEKKKGDADGAVGEIEGRIASILANVNDDTFNLSYSERLHLAEKTCSDLELNYYALKDGVDAAKLYWDTLVESSSNMSEVTSIYTQIQSLEEQIISLSKTESRAREDFADQLKSFARSSASDSGETTDTAYIGTLDNDVFEYLEVSIIRSYDWEDAERNFRSILIRSLNDAGYTVDDAVLAEIDEYIESASSAGKQHKRSIEDSSEQMLKLDRELTEERDKLRLLGVDINDIDSLEEYAVTKAIEAAEKEYNNLKTEFTEMEDAYQNAKNNAENLGKVVEYEVQLNEQKSLSADIEQQIENIAAKLERLNEQKGIDELKKDVERLERQVTSDANTLEMTKLSIEKNSVQREQTRAAQAREIEDLKAKIEAYKNAPETTNVTAPIAGRIVEINVVPGNSVTSGNTVAQIEIAEKGYLCEISVPTEEARKIQVGAECSITNFYWGNVEASVTAVRNDPQSQGKNRIVVIEIKGDVNEGQTLNFTIGDRSQSYNSVLPNSAIREDSEGKFVLVVESKNTPLGVRYTAVRYPIDVVASDDTKSAVSGLMGSEFVITNASSPVTDGQQVRLSEG